MTAVDRAGVPCGTASRSARGALALLPLLAGCDLVTDSFLTNDFSGDPFPIEVETHAGAIVLGLRQAGTDDRVAVLDLLSPMTVTDAGPDASPAVSHADLTLLGQQSRGGAFDQPRAVVPDAQILSLHPCANAVPDCAVGPLNAPRSYQAIVGADILAGDAVRLALATDEIFVLADIAGSNAERTYACDAVFASPYRGGGTLVIGGTELPFGNRRITLNTCLAPDPDPALPQSARGADVLLVASTGIGITILSATAYERYRQSQARLPFPPPPRSALPVDTVFLPSGLVSGNRGTLPSLAIVGGSSANTRAPCRQVFAHHLMTERNCEADDDCPCDITQSTFCPVTAVMELAPSGGFGVLVVDDTDPTLQALRTELRPDQPEVDGILGLDAMRLAEIDVDFPHDRVLARCAADRCRVRPELAAEGARTQIRGCLGEAPN